jgi:hypothetical protein
MAPTVDRPTCVAVALIVGMMALLVLVSPRLSGSAAAPRDAIAQEQQMAPPQQMVLNEATGLYEPVIKVAPPRPSENDLPANATPANNGGQRAGLAVGGGLLLRLLWWYRKLKREGQL